MNARPWPVILCSLLAATPIVGHAVAIGAGPVKPTPVKVGPPVVFISAYEEYEHIKVLTNPVNSAIVFASNMLALHCHVTLISDAKSSAKVEAAIPANPQLKVLIADEAEELDNHFNAWINDNFRSPKQNASRGMVSINGHGEKRDGELFFLTSTDEEGTGGVSIHKWQDTVGTEHFPIAFIVDTCRTKAPRQPVASVSDPKQDAPNDPPAGRMSIASVAKLISATRGSGVTISKGRMDDPFANHGALTLYSTHDNKAAADMPGDLVHSMAVGAADPVGSVFFQAKEDKNNVVPALERDSDLSLLTWILFAQKQVLTNTGGDQHAEYDRGSIDETMVFASRDKRFVALPSANNLLHSWGDFAETGISAERASYGVVLKRRAGAALTTLYAVGGFGDKGVDPIGKSLVVEVIARTKSPTKGVFKCLLQPCDYQAGKYYTSKWSTEQQIPWNTPTTRVVHLDTVPKGGLLKNMALGPVAGQGDKWTEEIELIVTRLLLVDNNDPRAKEQVGINQSPALVPIDLISRWWSGDVIRANEAATVITQLDGLKQHRYFTMKISESEFGQTAGKGGPVYPPIFADADKYELEFVVKSFQASPKSDGKCKLIVWMEDTGVLRNADEQMIASDIEINNEMIGKPRRLPIRETGFGDYFALTTDAAAIEFSSLAIVPKKR